MQATRDLHQIKRHIQTESKRIEKDISCKWKFQKSLGSNTYIRQNRPLKKGYNKRQRRKLHNDKRTNSTRGYNP